MLSKHEGFKQGTGLEEVSLSRRDPVVSAPWMCCCAGVGNGPGAGFILGCRFSLRFAPWSGAVPGGPRKKNQDGPSSSAGQLVCASLT